MDAEHCAGRTNKVIKVAAFGLLIVGSHIAIAQYKLPPSAQITIGKLEVDKTAPQEAETCTQLGYSLSVKQVRTMFRTYHKLREGEQHAYYASWRCWIKGTIKADGKSFFWRANPGNTLDTDWPDGVEKILGGKHTDDPSGH